MIRKIYLLLPLLLLAVIFMACEETSEEGKYSNWKARNEAFIDSLQNVVDSKNDPELRTLIDSRNGTTLFYKILDDGDDTQKRVPLNGSVNIYRRGMLIDEAVFNAVPNEKYYTRLYENLDIFQTNFEGDDPDPLFEATTLIAVDASVGADMVDGLREALLWMYPGARWELYIPYKSGYGTSSYSGIPGYSTLIFDIILDSIEEY